MEDDDDDDNGDDDIPSVNYRLGKQPVVCAELKFILTLKPTFSFLLFFFLCVLILLARYKRAYRILDALMVNNMGSISISPSGITLKPKDEA